MIFLEEEDLFQKTRQDRPVHLKKYECEIYFLERLNRKLICGVTLHQLVTSIHRQKSSPHEQKYLCCASTFFYNPPSYNPFTL